MPAHVLTGAPGAGKTALLRLLEVNGHAVVEEAATDVIALAHAQGREQPWQDPDFIDRVVTLQRLRSARAADPAFHDRSPICTLALSRYLGRAPSRLLTEEVDRVIGEGVCGTVFFVRNLGFVERTAARRISFEDSLAFEEVHERTYRDLGFTPVDVPAGPLAERAALVLRAVGEADPLPRERS